MSSGQSSTSQSKARSINTPRQVLFASLIGTTIEFFDFYIYATAAVIVFPRLFFPASDPASATLASLAIKDGWVAESARRPAADVDDERRRYYRLTPLGRRLASAEADRLWRLVTVARSCRLLTRA